MTNETGMATDTLLVEIFTEELPPRALARLGEYLADDIFVALKAFGLLSEDSARKWFATPRRLGVSITHVKSKGQDKQARVRLLPVSAALDQNGKPTAALVKKLATLPFPEPTLGDLERAVEGKSEYFFHNFVAPGMELCPVMQVTLKNAVEGLPIPKVMRYQTETGDYVEFVRPAHGLVALHGSHVVPVSVLGLQAGRVTHGHRFQGAKDITLTHADGYENKLSAEGGVIASFTERLSEIKKQLEKHATALGAQLDFGDGALLNEVTALVEMPTVYVGEFEKEFLTVPQECLILTMQANQKYFPLFDAAGKLLSKFLIVSNMNLPGPGNIIEGNQRVIRPRLADARFFYEQDKKVKLVDRLPQLARIVYHNKLGSQYDRSERIQGVSKAIAEKLGGGDLLGRAMRAGILSKADLVTNMVSEFPELQGTMGRYYARNDNESDSVAIAIEDHYKPRFAGDELPRNDAAVVVALADKLDTLVGMFGIDQIPTGDKDPFALRRHALGVIRILIEKDIHVGLSELIAFAQTEARKQTRHKLNAAQLQTDESAGYQSGPVVPLEEFGPTDESMERLKDFFYDRLVGVFREQGHTPQEIDAVISMRPDILGDVPKRLAAVRAFATLPEAEALSAANKRTRNILKKADGAGQVCNPDLLADAAEMRLHASVVKLAPVVSASVAAQDYTGALKQLATIRGDVDKFFDDVLVMDDDPKVRANRLALLSQLEKLMNQVADISKLAA